MGMGWGEGGTNLSIVGDNGDVLHGDLTGYVVATSLYSREFLLPQVDAVKRLCIKKFPKVLVIRLKRFVRGHDYIIQAIRRGVEWGQSILTSRFLGKASLL